jgi:hypothetical protein
VKVPAQPPAIVAHTATQKKVPAIAWPHIASARANSRDQQARRPIRVRHASRRRRGEAPAVAVIDTRLATSGMLTPRSCAISSRKGARVVPLEVAAKEPRQAAPIRAQGSAREAVGVIKGRRPYRPPAAEQ